ncbi:hypothetical protein [Candidatus Albibeggiatoa sp. nov. BB20]|uniref:hypothetical protein n=1 Tax=Candidatus Albibeggiatoa sp. nov. BB20 TaxID=3162723 RepID=UPI00336541BB
MQPNNEKVKSLLSSINVEPNIQHKSNNLVSPPLLINKVGDKKFLTIERNKDAVHGQARTIIVLGCPRGGTSAISGALH